MLDYVKSVVPNLFLVHGIKFYIFTIMVFVYVYVSGLPLVQLPTFGHSEHLIASILM